MVPDMNPHPAAPDFLAAAGWADAQILPLAGDASFRRYFRVFPRFVLQQMHMELIETIKCFVADRDRLHKLRNFLLGSWDGLTGRMGKREGI